ncbi:hypothetical protein BX600DRAFT_454304 [Xylariales sp. PMI_506]|nr:hypothetical protein BX600DRAFT_454304 [Xylariales sp. PMI_506]
MRPTEVCTTCPACARILHVRWVEIVTLEHQWMHERGACGCEVKFPTALRPRVVGNCNNGDKVVKGTSTDLTGCSTRLKDWHNDRNFSKHNCPR